LETKIKIMSQLRLTRKAKNAILENSPKIKSELALALGCSEGTINRYLRDIETDDSLTKAAALIVIHQASDIPFELMLEPLTNKPSAAEKSKTLVPVKFGSIQRWPKNKTI
jgi:hypothetical protein